MPARLGQLLITSNIITEDQLKEALGLQRKEGGRLGSNLVKLGHITEEKLQAFLSRQYNVPAINLTDYKIDPCLLKLIPIDMARKYLIMPVARVGATITIAMVDPSNVFAIDDVKFRTVYNVEVVEEREDAEVIREVAPPIVKLVNGMLVNAIKSGASDVHVEPYESSVRVRQRIDGQMYTIMNLPAQIKAAVSSRFKIMAKLDIAERRLPQGGRIKLQLGTKREIDFRVST